MSKAMPFTSWFVVDFWISVEPFCNTFEKENRVLNANYNKKNVLIF